VNLLAALAAVALQATPSAGAVPAEALPPAPLEFRELFAPGPDLLVSDKARALKGRRVRMEGYAARLEESPTGGFWLTPVPVQGDESGGGVGDLPPGAVLVKVRSAGGRPVNPAARGRIAVTGLLEVGRSEEGGQSSLFRIVLDRGPATRQKAATRPKAAPGAAAKSS
jgi:hypothetical protein